MKRSKFIKLSARSMTASTFLSFPLLSKTYQQESSFNDIFSGYFIDDHNNNYSIYLGINLDDDPELNNSIEVKSDDEIVKCLYFFTKIKQPYKVGKYLRHPVSLEGKNPSCNTNNLPKSDLYNVLKNISYIDFKPRKRNLLANSKFEEARILDQKKELIFELAHDKVKGGEECFLTSACVAHKGLPDNCVELKKLRKFRDEYMLKHPEGKEMIADYYVLAPSIVNELKKATNNDVYEFIYNELVLKCIDLIENDKPELAMYYYKSFTEELGLRILN